MKKIQRLFFSISPAIVACLAMAALSIVFAFFGADNVAGWMRSYFAIGAVALLATWLFLLAVFSARKRNPASFLLHVACGLILLGWLIGAVVSRHSGCPGGEMSLSDGDRSSSVLRADGGKVELPFEIKLEKFFVKRYTSSNAIRQYRSRISVFESGREPYYADVEVNRPVRIGGYWVYQDGWGRDARSGRLYTVLKFSRAPGWVVVLCGYALTLLGAAFLVVATFRRFGAVRKGVKV